MDQYFSMDPLRELLHSVSSISSKKESETIKEALLSTLGDKSPEQASPPLVSKSPVNVLRKSPQDIKGSGSGESISSTAKGSKVINAYKDVFFVYGCFNVFGSLERSVKAKVVDIAEMKQKYYGTLERQSIISANKYCLAYALSKNIRLLTQSDGRKAIMSLHHADKLPLVALEWNNQRLGHMAMNNKSPSNQLLASLSEKGEFFIGIVYADTSENFEYEPVLSMTFPDLFPAKGLAWSQDLQNLLVAVYGGEQTAIVFLVWVRPSCQTIELPLPEQDALGPIESIAFFNHGKRLALGSTKELYIYEIQECGKVAFEVNCNLAHFNLSRIWIFCRHSGELIIFGFDGEGRFLILCLKENFKFEILYKKRFFNSLDNESTEFLVDYDGMKDVAIVTKRNGSELYCCELAGTLGKPVLCKIDWPISAASEILSISLAPQLYDDISPGSICFYSHHGDWIKFSTFPLSSSSSSSSSLPTIPLSSTIQSVEDKKLAKQEANEADVSGVVEKKVSELVKNFERNLKPSMESSFKNNVNELLERHFNVNNINSTIYAATRDCIVENLIPSMEAVLTELVRQSTQQIKQELMDIVKKEVLDIKSILGEINRDVQTFPKANDLVQSLSEELVRNAKSHVEQKRGLSIVDALLAAATQNAFGDLEELINQRQYSQALVKALSAGNLDILIHVCKRLNPTDTLDSPEINNEALLSLGQQLACDLNQDTECKLDWLIEGFTIFSAKSIKDTEICEKVLDEIFNNLRLYFIQLTSNSPLYKKFKSAMRLVRHAMEQ